MNGKPRQQRAHGDLPAFEDVEVRDVGRISLWLNFGLR